MRVAVIGATGNVGTAVLEALAQTEGVASLVGIARRMPDTTSSPYSDCEWASIDIAAASSRESAHDALVAALRGADAVIHLAWLVQPNTDRDLLRRVNVEGTRRVAEAVAEAKVPHLVVASSVGAYSPDRRDLLRAEDWPIKGISTSHYSVDKAAQERVLDTFESNHPEIVVTRLRPALIIGGSAASEVQRYFLASWMPLGMLSAIPLPILPLPAGLRGLQAVHSSDVARAYAAAVLHRRGGAFNICAEDVLRPQDLADLIDHGRHVPVPDSLVRASMGIGHSSRLLAADTGWLDMGLNVPLMASSRAVEQLDWRPRYTARDALGELLAGMAAGQGGVSVPLRPRDSEPTARERSRSAISAADANGSLGGGVDRRLLQLYLDDHLAGATAGVERLERMAADFVDTPVFAVVSKLAREIRDERMFVACLISELGLRRRRLAEVSAWAGERLGRLKFNGRLLKRSPMTLVLETELMRSAVIGKRGMWQLLADNADVIGLKREAFASLAAKADDQLSVLDEVHEFARRRAFLTDREVFTHDSDESPVGEG